MEITWNLTVNFALLIALGGAIWKFGKWTGSVNTLLAQLTKGQMATTAKIDALEVQVARFEGAHGNDGMVRGKEKLLGRDRDAGPCPASSVGGG